MSGVRGPPEQEQTDVVENVKDKRKDLNSRILSI